jgi:threonine synthase
LKYVSTRGKAPILSFEEAMLEGLASDGGLYVPEKIPNFTREEISTWSSLTNEELAFKIMSPFIDGEVPDDDLKSLINKTYRTFNHKAIAPLVQTARNEFVLELFHECLHISKYLPF